MQCALIVQLNLKYFRISNDSKKTIYNFICQLYSCSYKLNKKGLEYGEITVGLLTDKAIASKENTASVFW